MTSRNVSSPENQSVTFVELFFDLVFVFAVTVIAIVGLSGIAAQFTLAIALGGVLIIAVVEQRADIPVRSPPRDWATLATCAVRPSAASYP